MRPDTDLQRPLSAALDSVGRADKQVPERDERPRGGFTSGQAGQARATKQAPTSLVQQSARALKPERVRPEEAFRSKVGTAVREVHHHFATLLGALTVAKGNVVDPGAAARAIRGMTSAVKPFTRSALTYGEVVRRHAELVLKDQKQDEIHALKSGIELLRDGAGFRPAGKLAAHCAALDTAIAIELARRHFQAAEHSGSRIALEQGAFGWEAS
ncbi:MAG: hypothetical protein ABIR26_13650 [Ramlibacter sp.]